MDAGFPHAFSADHLGDETQLVRSAAERTQLAPDQAQRVRALTGSLVTKVRAARRQHSGLDACASRTPIPPTA
jgi:hypothetical protein